MSLHEFLETLSADQQAFLIKHLDGILWNHLHPSEGLSDFVDEIRLVIKGTRDRGVGK